MQDVILPVWNGSLDNIIRLSIGVWKVIKISKPTNHQKSKKKKLIKSVRKWHNVIDPYTGEKMKVLGTSEWIKEQFGRLHAFRGGNKRWK